jgi:hypothetical protein
LIDLNSDRVVIVASSFDMMRLNVVALVGFKETPFTDSVPTIYIVVESTARGAIGGDNVLSGIESFWTKPGCLADSKQAVIVTGHVESVLGRDRRDEPALEDIADVGSFIIGSGEGGSD